MYFELFIYLDIYDKGFKVIYIVGSVIVSHILNLLLSSCFFNFDNFMHDQLFMQCL